MNSESLPTPTWSGSFHLFGVDVKCHVLSNGQRIIESDSVAALFQAMSETDAECDEDEMTRFANWQSTLEERDR